MVNDGVQFDDTGRWYREVDVAYFDETRGMAAHVSLSVRHRAYVGAGPRRPALGCRPDGAR